MPTVATVGDSGKLSLAGTAGDIGMGGGVGEIYQLEDIILSRFLSQDAYAMSFLGRIRTGSGYRVNPHLISGEGLTLKHFGMERHGTRKWDPPPSKEAFFIPKRGDIIFINQFF